MRKTLVVLSTLILIMILSTGCGSNKHLTSEEIIELPSFWQPTVEATLPESNLPEIVPIVEESSTEIETEETIAIVEITEEETTVAEESMVEQTTIEETTIEETTIEKTTEEETEVIAAETPKYTFTEFTKYMYTQGKVNVRTLPCIDGEVLVVYDMNYAVWVTGRCKETGWYRIDIEGQPFYISDKYLADTKVVNRSTPATTATAPVSTAAAGFVYYSVSGVYPNKDYEQYLYNQLSSLGIAWWYPYAVAQIFQESRWNPNSTNGKDHGICQFKGIYFQGRAEYFAGMKNADIWNPYDSLKVYAYYIQAILRSHNNNVNSTLSFYICGDDAHWDQTYIDHVMGWYYKLGK